MKRGKKNRLFTFIFSFMPGAAEMRNRVNCAETKDEVMEIMENAFKNTVSFPDFPQN